MASKNKKTKEKKKLVFAKNKNQAILAVVVICLFAANSAFMGVQSYLKAQSNNASLEKAAKKIAQQQEEDLRSLEDPNQMASKNTPDNNNIYSETLGLRNHDNQNPEGANANNPQGSDNEVEIIPKKPSQFKKGDKTVMIAVSDSGRSDPFLPASENAVSSSSLSYLSSPPDTLPSGSDASKVMTTTISGILYDKYNPSAIINIEGNDYLVKKGDIINSYKVLSISQHEVLVKLGKNVYKAGVGEILTDTGMNYNVIANLDKKFGGNDVSIHVKKKTY